MSNRHPAEATETIDAPDSFGLRVLIHSLDPFQRQFPTDLRYVQEEMRDRGRELLENEYNHRARWGHD